MKRNNSSGEKVQSLSSALHGSAVCNSNLQKNENKELNLRRWSEFERLILSLLYIIIIIIIYDDDDGERLPASARTVLLSRKQPRSTSAKVTAGPPSSLLLSSWIRCCPRALLPSAGHTREG